MIELPGSLRNIVLIKRVYIHLEQAGRAWTDAGDRQQDVQFDGHCGDPLTRLLGRYWMVSTLLLLVPWRLGQGELQYAV